jgi:hypothetical protein
MWVECLADAASLTPSPLQTQVPAVVQGWNVARLPLRRTARHLDQTVMMEFYEKLDAFLVSKRRSDLVY